MQLDSRPIFQKNHWFENDIYHNSHRKEEISVKLKFNVIFMFK